MSAGARPGCAAADRAPPSAESQEQQHARAVGDVMKAFEDCGENGSAQLASGCRPTGLQGLEMSRAPRRRQARPSRPARRPVQGCTRTAPPASGHYNDHRRSSFVHASSRVSALRNIATRLRIDSVRATTDAGSGHPPSCCSAADLTAAIFFSEMRYDPRIPRTPTTIGSCCRRDMRRRCSTRPGPRPASSGATNCLTASTLRFRSRGTSHAAAAVGGCRHRIARAGNLRRHWHRA